MKRSFIDIKELLDIENLKSKGINHGLVFSLGDVQLCNIENIKIDENTLIEARLFGESCEIYAFKNGNRMVTVFNEEEDGDEVFKEEQLLMSKFGGKILIKNYIKYDEEDSQAYIAYTRPYGLVSGGELNDR